MTRDLYYPPEHAKGQYHCPHCNVYAKQTWSHLRACGDAYAQRNSYKQVIGKSSISDSVIKFEFLLEKEWTISLCDHCNGKAIWKSKKIIFPNVILAGPPNKDLERDIQEDYFEAANILNASPRAAAAILRLALQKLCIQLGEKGKKIDDDIASLVKKGLSPTIQKSLDTLRITGNNAVHPGEINLKEDAARVLKLFGLINFIAEKMITEPKEIESFYESLPESQREAVKKRDKK